MSDYGSCPLCSRALVEVDGVPGAYTAIDSAGNDVAIPDSMQLAYSNYSPSTPFTACPTDGITYAGIRGERYVFARIGDTHRYA